MARSPPISPQLTLSAGEPPPEGATGAESSRGKPEAVATESAPATGDPKAMVEGEDAYILLRGHTGAVLCFLQPRDYPQLILTGSGENDCSVRVWDFRSVSTSASSLDLRLTSISFAFVFTRYSSSTGMPVHVFRHHTAPVAHLCEPPPSPTTLPVLVRPAAGTAATPVGSALFTVTTASSPTTVAPAGNALPPASKGGWRGWFASVGIDGVVAVCSLERMQCLHMLGPHPPPVVAVHWSMPANCILVRCGCATAAAAPAPSSPCAASPSDTERVFVWEVCAKCPFLIVWLMGLCLAWLHS